MNYLRSEIIPFYEIIPYGNDLSFSLNIPLRMGSLTGENYKLIDFSSLSVTERIDEPATGVLTIIDNSNILDSVLRYGTILKVTMGLKESKRIKSNFFESTFDEISGDKERTIVFYITNKNISCSDGIVTYRYILKQGDVKQNIPNFESISKTFGGINASSGAYTYDVIKCLSEYMSLLYRENSNTIDSYYIHTSGGFSDYTMGKTYQRYKTGIWFQQESSVNKTGYGFLQYMASKYKFNIYNQTNDKGKSILYLLDSEGYEKYKFKLAEKSGREGRNHKFNYGTYSSNIISIDFDSLNQELFSGGSKRAFIDKSGQVTISEQENDKIVYYKINMKKIKKELKGKGTAQITQRLSEIATSDFANDWDRLKKEYFEPVVQSPNSTQTSLGAGGKSRGQTAKIKNAINPLFQIGDLVDIGPDGEESLIPYSLRSNSIDNDMYKIISIDHTINSSGYEMQVEVAR